jgi:hypothetical protein
MEHISQHFSRSTEKFSEAFRKKAHVNLMVGCMNYNSLVLIHQVGVKGNRIMVFVLVLFSLMFQHVLHRLRNVHELVLNNISKKIKYIKNIHTPSKATPTEHTL